MKRLLRKSLGLIVFLSLASLLVSLWKWERVQQRRRIRALATQYADEAVARVELFMKTRMALLRSLQQLLQSRGFPGDSTFRREAAIVYHAVPGFRAVNWIDRSGRIAIVVPVVGNEPALGKDLHVHPDAAKTFARAERTGQVSVTPKVRLLQGGLGMATYWPVNDAAGHRLGYVNGVFDLSRIFTEALDRLADGDRIAVEVWAGSTRVVRMGSPRPIETIRVDRVVRFGPNRWEIRLWPGPGLYPHGPARAATSWLITGLTMAAGVAVLVTLLDRRRTEYRRARDEARLSEARLSSILEASPYRIYALDERFRVLFESRARPALTVSAPTNGDGERRLVIPEKALDPGDAEKIRRGIERALRGEVHVSEPFRVHEDEGHRWVRAVWAPLRDRAGELLGAVGIEMDCTEQQEALEKLRRSEEWNRLLIENLQSMVMVLDADGTVLSANPAAERYLGAGPSQLVGKPVFDWLAPDATEALRRDMARALSSGLNGGASRYHFRRTSGEEVIVEGSWSRLEMPGGDAALLFVGADVTERVRAEKALESSERRFRVLFDSIPEAVFVFDPSSYRILDVNRVAVQRYGFSREEFLNLTILDIRPPEQVPVVKKMLRKGSVCGHVPGEYLHRTRDGRVFPVAIYAQSADLDGRRVVIAVAVDLTERKRAEREQEELRRQLFQAQRMEAIGRLAGGIAHDFNNMLTGILGLASLIESETRPGEPGHEEARDIKQICRRASELVSKLLAFSRRQIIAPRPIAVNDVVRDMSPLLQQVIGENVTLELSLDPGIPPAVADRAQLEQVVLNLAVNARDAMPQGGMLTIRTWAETVEDGGRGSEGGRKRGRYVVLSVRDTGLGMDEETRARAFDPFFTTKQEKGSSGLGLAVVYGIVRQHGGFIELDTAPGRGTEFRIFWPAAEDEPVSVEGSEGEAAAGGRGETVLVVEDEDTVRRMAARALRRYGYEVLEARDAREAVKLLDEHPDVELVFSDVVMPGMSGTELRRVAQQRRPGLRFLFSSGYTTDGVHENFVLGESVHFLPKPYDPERLARKVREVLDEG